MAREGTGRQACLSAVALGVGDMHGLGEIDEAILVAAREVEKLQLGARGSRVGQRFTHGPGFSYLREVAAKAPGQAAGIIAARRDGLRANMSATLRAMKAAAESAQDTGVGPG